MPNRFVRNGVIYKECSGCGEEKPHDAEHYYRAGKYKDKTQRFYTTCKECCKQRDRKERTDRSEIARERQKRRLRARQRAWVRLGQEWPERFQELYAEELFREGPVPKEKTA